MTFVASAESVVRDDRRVELVGFALACGERSRSKSAPTAARSSERRHRSVAGGHDRRLAGANSRACSEPRPWCRAAAGFTASVRAVHDVVVDAVLHERRRVVDVRRAPVFVSFSVKSNSRRALDSAASRVPRSACVELDGRPCRRSAAAPGARMSRVPTTTCCETRRSAAHAAVRDVRPRLTDRDADQDVVGRRLRVLDEDIEVAVVVEDAGVDQLELRILACRGGGSPRRAARTGTPPADTCRDTSCTSASACCRDRSSTP